MAADAQAIPRTAAGSVRFRGGLAISHTVAQRGKSFHAVQLPADTGKRQQALNMLVHEEVDMASIRKEIRIEAPVDRVWDALKDVGALHTKLVPGFVTDTRMEGKAA